MPSSFHDIVQWDSDNQLKARTSFNGWTLNDFGDTVYNYEIQGANISIPPILGSTYLIDSAATLAEAIESVNLTNYTHWMLTNHYDVPENEQQNIFKRFYRVGSELTRNTKGTGLGLYIVKQLVDFHQASINVTKNSPKGTIFAITF